MTLTNIAVGLLVTLTIVFTLQYKYFIGLTTFGKFMKGASQ